MRNAVNNLKSIIAKLAKKARVISRMLVGAGLAYFQRYIDGNDYSTAGVVGLAVTDAGSDVTYGDYFTAMELSVELKKSGYQVKFLRRHAGNWYYEASKCEVVISLLESFNPKKIKYNKRGSKPYCVAWARNWFERWVESPGMQSYNLILASSDTASDFMRNKTGLNVEVFPLATSTSRFGQKVENAHYQRELCFTGSYWFDRREVENLLDTSKLKNLRFDIFGDNWGHSKKFSQFWRGFRAYENLPEVYKTTKIVLDDANFVTKPYGAVNSRVYDALASGALVLTNGRLGALETFDGLLPVYTSSDELHHQIDYYLKNEEARLAKIHKLQQFVLENHTYQKRVVRLLELLKHNKAFVSLEHGLECK